ncbi:uncharacterized protein PGRI_013630 [Penicillium griseofulvum]|uniref:Uncharacterized protein n=1 Tax=Penicillium patulum TaxID=5078 RepID=A0A135LEV1_PENPA|nr:uncharacterized protein PGRI_013630 [Penicillium griseofulvum]KXG47493.1 hypothetical protein PGRI_013630 [Penicillium griseofulvum]
MGACFPTYPKDTYLLRLEEIPYPKKISLNTLKELFRRSEIWDEGIPSLRETLIKLFRKQQDLGFERDLSLNFSNEKIAAHTKEFQVYQEWHEIRSFVKKILGTDDDGWIAPERDFTEMKARNKMLFDYYVSKPDLNKTAGEVRDLWPFSLDT